MKKILALVMVFAIFVSIATFPAAAATNDDDIEPRYSVTECPSCGGNVRYVKRVIGYQTSRALRNSCYYREPGTDHYHGLMKNYDLYRCENCGYSITTNVNNYEYCPSKPGTM